jgi:hypothetical protein
MVSARCGIIEPAYNVLALVIMFAYVLGTLVAAVLSSGDGPPQTGAVPIVEPGLTIHAVARRLASPADAAPALHWVAEPFPGVSNVTISHPPLRTAVADALSRLAAGEPGCPTWVLEISQTCTLGARLERELAAFSFHVRDHVDLLDPPDVEGKELSVIVRVDYVVLQTVPLVRSLIIDVATEHAKGDGADTALTLTARDAAARAGAPAPPPMSLDVPITVRLTEADRTHHGGTPLPVSQLQNELLRVGLSALRAAGDGGLVPNGPAPSDAALTAIDDALLLVYAVERPAWPARVATTRGVSREDFSIALTRLRFVSRVNVDVIPAVIERDNGRFTFQGATAAGEARLAALRRAAAEQARARLRTGRDPLEGTIPTRARVLATVEQLRQQTDIRFINLQSGSDGTITFQSAYHDVESELGAKFDLRATLDPEQFLTGTGTLHEHNILYVLLRRNIQEDVDLTASGGPQVQNVSLDLSVSRERGTTHVVTYGFTARTFFSRDTNQRLGNLPAFRGRDEGDVQLVDQEWGEVPKLFLQYEWQAAWRQRVRWEGGLDWRRVLIRPHLSALPARVDGRLSAWDNSLEYRLSHDFTPASANPGAGIGELTLVATGAFRRGTRHLSGDFDFSRPQVSSTTEGLFGWRTRQDLLVRHTWLAGDATAGTPLFQLHRLGGATNVRGIEEGEYVGRTLRAQQFTVGIGLPVLWPALAQPGGPAALVNSYVTMFYDRGRVTLDEATRDAHGYGVGVEIRNLPAGRRRAHISIGWARSPQSFLHRRGVMTMGVHFGL